MCSEAVACTGMEDNVLDTILGVGKEEDCQLLCQQSDLCQIYTWYPYKHYIILTNYWMMKQSSKLFCRYDASEFLANFCVLLR